MRASRSAVARGAGKCSPGTGPVTVPGPTRRPSRSRNPSASSKGQRTTASSRSSMRKPHRIVFALATLIGAIALSGHLFAQGTVSISVNGSNQFQSIDGFGVNINSASWNNGELRPALDLLSDTLGATVWRVVIDNADWEATNDNSDPATFNWTYYNTVYTSPKFEELWSTIEYLNSKGHGSLVILNVMGPVAEWMGGSQINTNAED